MKKTNLTCILTLLTIGLCLGQGLEVTNGTANNSNGEGGYAIIGEKANKHISIDNQSIQTRFDFGASTLNINPYGGNVSLLGTGRDGNLSIDGSGVYYHNLQNRLGIGTSFPTVKLDVDGDTQAHNLSLTANPGSDDAFIRSTSQPSADLFLVSSDNIRFDLDENNDEGGALEVFNGANQNVMTLGEQGGMSVKGNLLTLANLSDTKSIELRTTGSAVDLQANNTNLFLTAVGTGSNDIIIGENGSTQIGVGRTNPTYKVDLLNNSDAAFGWIRAYGYATYSDRRIKSNFRQIKNVTHAIMQLAPLKYTHYNTEETNAGFKLLKNQSTEDVGFVAQDVYKVFPELVHKPKNEDTDLWSVNYVKLIPYLTKAIQEQQQLIDLHKEIITALQSNLQELRTALKEK